MYARLVAPVKLVYGPPGVVEYAHWFEIPPSKVIPEADIAVVRP